MRRFPCLLSSIAVLSVAFILLGLAEGQGEGRKPRKVAFLVGVEKYDHALDPALFAERDVRELAKVLQNAEECRVLRGGSWDFGGEVCRAASRSRNAASFRSGGVGFRVALRLD